MQISNPSSSRLPQKPVTRRTDLPTPIPQLNQEPHWLVKGFLWLLPVQLLMGSFFGLPWVAHFFHFRYGIWVVPIGILVLIVSFFGPGLLFAILTARSWGQRKGLGDRIFEFFLAQMLVVPSAILLGVLIRKLFPL